MSLPSASAGNARSVLHLRGIMKSGTIGQVAFTLPSGYQPAKAVTFAVDSVDGASGDIYVQTNGDVQPVYGNNGYMFLNQIYFQADGS